MLLQQREAQAIGHGGDQPEHGGLAEEVAEFQEKLQAQEAVKRFEADEAKRQARAEKAGRNNSSSIGTKTVRIREVSGAGNGIKIILCKRVIPTIHYGNYSKPVTIEELIKWKLLPKRRENPLPKLFRNSPPAEVSKDGWTKLMISFPGCDRPVRIIASRYDIQVQIDDLKEYIDKAKAEQLVADAQSRLRKKRSWFPER